MGLGLSPRRVSVPVPALFAAASYHVELLAPDKLFIASARLTKQQRRLDTDEAVDE